MKVLIEVLVDDDSEHADLGHEMGITDEAYERLTGYPAPLSWLGEVQEVTREEGT